LRDDVFLKDASYVFSSTLCDMMDEYGMIADGSDREFNRETIRMCTEEFGAALDELIAWVEERSAADVTRMLVRSRLARGGTPWRR
jgi:hypothetical protein